MAIFWGLISDSHQTSRLVSTLICLVSCAGLSVSNQAGCFLCAKVGSQEGNGLGSRGSSYYQPKPCIFKGKSIKKTPYIPQCLVPPIGVTVMTPGLNPGPHLKPKTPTLSLLLKSRVGWKEDTELEMGVSTEDSGLFQCLSVYLQKNFFPLCPVCKSISVFSTSDTGIAQERVKHQARLTSPKHLLRCLQQDTQILRSTLNPKVS